MTESKLIVWSLLSGWFIYLGMNEQPIWIFSILMVIDFVTGILASYVADKNEVKSKTAVNWLIRKVSIFMIPFVVALVIKGGGYTGDLANGLVTTIVSLLIVSEGYSVLGNIYGIKTGKKVPEIDATERLLDFVRGLFESSLSPKK